MDDWEKEAFRVFKIIEDLERAIDIIVQYRAGIDFWRERIDELHITYGWLFGRRGDPEPPARPVRKE